MMPHILIIVLALLILISSFLEIIVFNEEVLLALCFIAFVFFAYTYLNNTFFAIFEDHANKIETDLLLAFKTKFDVSVVYFQELLFVKGFSKNLEVLEALTEKYINNIVVALNIKLLADSSTILAVKLNEIFVFEQKIFILAQKNCIQAILYPVIFLLGKNYGPLLSSIVRSKPITAS
jgi:hypothetical protein